MQELRVLFLGFNREERRILLSEIERTCQGVLHFFASLEEINHSPELTEAYDAVVLQDRGSYELNLDLTRWRSLDGSSAIIVCIEKFDAESVLHWLNHGAQRVIPFGEFGAYFPDCLLALTGRTQHKGDEYIQSLDRMKILLHDPEESDPYLEFTVNAVNAFVVIFNDRGKILFINRAAEIISGTTKEAVIGKNYFDLFLVDEERDKIREKILVDIPNRNSIHHQSSLVTQKGDLRRLVWSMTIVEGALGESVHFLGIGMDITEEYLKGLAFQESERHLSAILKSSPIGICILSLRDGTILDANSSMGNIFERSEDSLIGMKVTDLGLDHSQEKFLEELEKQSRKGKHLSIERVIFTSKRRKVHVLFTAEIFHSGVQKEILLMVQDISERARIDENNRKINDGLESRVLERTAELEAVNRELQQEIGFRKLIEQSSQRLTQIIWETPDIVAICDLNGRMLYLNKAGRIVLGMNDQESISHLMVYSFYPPEAKEFITEILTKIVGRDGYWYGETDLMIQDGMTIPTSQVILAHKDVNGKMEFYSTIARDVSTQIRAANELKRAYEQEKKLGNFRSNFFAMTSHQFRTPLSTILSSAELLENYSSLWTEEKRLRHFIRIKEATQRLNTMLDEILFIGRIDANIEHLSVESIDLFEFMETLVEKIIPTENCKRDIRVVDPGESVQIHTNSEILERIFDNLISNAIKYSQCDTKVELTFMNAGDGAVIQVIDQGIGISEEDLKLVFQPFHRGSNVVDTPGSGLGLMIVEKSLQMIHGSIQIESQLASGTRVTVHLPDLEKIVGQVQ
jgi:PAS domain S-box-containing protein